MGIVGREKICGIYCIESKKDSKKYIGQAFNIYDRWMYHKNSLRKNAHHSVHLQRAWNKYGEENFSFWIVERCDTDENILLEREFFWMKEYKTLEKEFGYNEREAGSRGRHSAETKEKMSKAAMGKPGTNLGKKFSEEHCKKMSLAQKGVKKKFPSWNKGMKKEKVKKVRKNNNRRNKDSGFFLF
jgi:group I intron endonuclease